MEHDVKVLKIIASVAAISFVLFPLEITEYLDHKTPIRAFELTKMNNIYLEEREYVNDLALFIKDEELQAIKTGYSLSLDDLYPLKLKEAGLVLDKEGDVVTKEEYERRLEKPYTFLILGSSSILEGLGPRLEYDLRKIDQMTVYRHGKYSSGLTRLDFYNWNLAAAQDVAKYSPQAIIIQIGGNDGQEIYSGGRNIPYSSSAWDAAYEERVHSFMKSIEDVKRVYWVDIPISAMHGYSQKMIRINAIQKKALERYPNVVYIESWDTFAPNGVYTPTLRNSAGVTGFVKAGDGIHLSGFGAGIMSELILKEIQKDLK